MFAVLLALLCGQAVAGQPAPVPDVRQLTLDTPKVLAEIETSKVQGIPIGLAWNSDGTVYLRVAQGTSRTRHYLIATSPSYSVAQSTDVPEWAAAYWLWKAGLTAPGDPSLKIDVEQGKQRSSSTGASGGGELAGMSSGALMGASAGENGTSQAAATAAALTSTTSSVVTMRLKGQVVGKWIDEAPQPGTRFGWAPEPMGVLAGVDADARLVLVDREGHAQRVAGATGALLPAWSLDGTRIVYLQKKSEHTYLLMIVGVR